MRRVLVVQLARFGDLLQTKRLLLSIAAEERTETHLCVDPSLAALAALIYPFARLHTLSCHSRPELFAYHVAAPSSANPSERPADRPAVRQSARPTDDSTDGTPVRQPAPPVNLLPFLGKELQSLAETPFDEVYLLNASPLSYALASLFPPESLRGRLRRNGQDMRDSWTKISSRLVRRRKSAPLNLVDLWAWHHPHPIAPERVNPIAKPARSGRIGIVMAGREARRSLPIPILAETVQAVFQAAGGPALVCLGGKAERPLARQLIRALPSRAARQTEDLTGSTSLADLPEILQSFDRLLTPDTGIMHLAAHLGVPVQAFFLSSAWCFETGPYGLGHSILQANIACSPCLESAACPYNTACLRPFMHKGPLARLKGVFEPEWPDALLGCTGAFDALGMTYRIVDGVDDKAEDRRDLRNALMDHLGLPGLRAVSAQAARVLYEESDWMLPQR